MELKIKELQAKKKELTEGFEDQIKKQDKTIIIL